jgi:hypothetical protein
MQVVEYSRRRPPRDPNITNILHDRNRSRT